MRDMNTAIDATPDDDLEIPPTLGPRAGHLADLGTSRYTGPSLMDRIFKRTPKSEPNSTIDADDILHLDTPMNDASNVIIENQPKKAGLFSRIRAAGKSLADPELRASAIKTIKDPAFLAQMGGSMAIGAGVKAALGGLATAGMSAVAAPAAVVAAAPFALAAAGGSAVSVLVGQMREDYKRANAYYDQPPEPQTIRESLAAFATHAKRFGSFSVRNTLSGNVFKNIARQWKNDKSVLVKRAAIGAGFGLLGAGLHELIGNAFHGPSGSSTDANAVVEAKPAAAPQAALTAGPQADVTPPSAVERAIALLEKDPDITDRVRESIEAAKEGKAWGIGNLGYFINNGLQGAPVDHQLGEALFTQAAEQNYKPAFDALEQIKGMASHAQPTNHVAAVADAPVSVPHDVAAAVETSVSANDLPSEVTAGIDAMGTAKPDATLAAPVEISPVESATPALGEDAGICYGNPQTPNTAVCQPTKWHMNIGDYFRFQNTATGQQTGVQFGVGEKGSNVLTSDFMVGSLKNAWDSLISKTGLGAAVANENVQPAPIDLASAGTAAPAMR